MSSGGAFGQFLEGPRRSIQDVRQDYSGLSNYLTGLGGTDPSALNPMFTSVYGDPSTEGFRSNILSSSAAALGMRPGTENRGIRNLGNIYDAMNTQYGPQAAGKFAQWIGSAYS